MERASFAKIGRLDLFQSQDLRGWTVGDFAAGDEHQKALGEGSDRAHDVLDHDDGHSFGVGC